MSFYNTNNPFTVGNIAVDSSVFIYIAKVILSGGMPYKDVFDHKGPLIYLIDALGLLINENIGIWVIEVITLFVIFFFTYKIAELLKCSYFHSYLTIIFGFWTFAVYFDGGNYTEEYACAFIIVSLYIFLKYLISGTVKSYEIIISGISFAAVCMLRINMIALWCVVGAFILIDNVKTNNKPEFLRLFGLFLLGVAIMILPIFLWLYNNGAFSEFIDCYFKFNFLYSSDPAFATLKGKIEAMAFFIQMPAVAISLTILVFFCVKENNRPIDFVFLTTLLFSIALSCLSGRTLVHYGMSWYPLVVFSVARLFSLLEVKTFSANNINTRSFSLAFICFMFFMFSTGIINFAVSMNNILVNRKGNWFQERRISQIVKDNTTQDDKIIVCGARNIVYLLSGRMSASKYSYQGAPIRISAELRKNAINDIKSLKAKVIVSEKVREAPHISKFVENITKKHYHLIAKIGDRGVYLRNEK